MRRMFHPGRGLGGPRARRSNMHFTSNTTGGLSGSQSSSQSSNYAREAMDPIAGQCGNTHTHHTTVGVCFSVRSAVCASRVVAVAIPCWSRPSFMRFSAWHLPCQLQLCHNEAQRFSLPQNRLQPLFLCLYSSRSRSLNEETQF